MKFEKNCLWCFSLGCVNKDLFNFSTNEVLIDFKVLCACEQSILFLCITRQFPLATPTKLTKILPLRGLNLLKHLLWGKQCEKNIPVISQS